MQALYANDEFFDKAETMGIFDPQHKVVSAMFLRIHVATQLQVYLNSR
jgi:hypothetical protein